MRNPVYLNKRYSLFELNEYIRQALALNFASPLWVRAEVLQSKFSKGHCFLELIEKGEGENEVVAQAEAVIWAKQFFALQAKLGTSLPALLRPGTEIQLLVEVTFHERYGLRLIVQDIDEGFTLGKLELKRQQTLEKLQKEGLLDRNKSVPLPLVVQRIAVISSPEAAGYHDFVNQLEFNPYGYQFKWHLFHAAMQGVNVTHEIKAQLTRINPSLYDVVVIIRGGGAKLDLTAFEEYELCEAIANFNLPVFTGIGHEVDETLLDRVAAISLKTPTAVAEHIIFHNARFEATLVEAVRTIHLLSTEMVYERQREIETLRQFILAECRRVLQNHALMLGFTENELHGACRNYLSAAAQQLANVESKLALLDPVSVMERGFALVQKNGKIVTSAGQLSAGDAMETVFADGIIKSTVN